MSTWQVTHRTTGEVVYAYTSDEPVEWPGMEYAAHNHNRVIEVVEVPKRRVTKQDFMDRLGDSIVSFILAAAKQDVEVEKWVKRLDLTTPDPDGTSIDLDDPRTVAGLNALEPALISQGVVSAGWAAGVVA